MFLRIKRADTVLPLPVQQAPHESLRTAWSWFISHLNCGRPTQICSADLTERNMVRADLREPRIKRRNHKPAHAGRFPGPMRGESKPARTTPKSASARKGAPTPHSKPYQPTKYTATETLVFSSTEGWDVTRLASGVKKIIFGDEFDVQE